MTYVYINAGPSGEITEVKRVSTEVEGWVRVPEDHPDHGVISVMTHYYDTEVRRYSNEMIAARARRPAYECEWDVQLGWVASVAVLKANVIEQINQERERRNNLPIQIGEYLFDADQLAQRNVSAWMAVVGAGIALPEGFFWRDYDNTDHPADASFVVGLGAAITQRGTLLYQSAWAKKAAVEALQTAQEVQAYDISAGW